MKGWGSWLWGSPRQKQKCRAQRWYPCGGQRAEAVAGGDHGEKEVWRMPCEALACDCEGREEARETPLSMWAGQGAQSGPQTGAPPRGEVSLTLPDFLPFSCTQKSGFLHEDS